VSERVSDYACVRACAPLRSAALAHLVHGQVHFAVPVLVREVHARRSAGLSLIAGQEDGAHDRLHEAPEGHVGAALLAQLVALQQVGHAPGGDHGLGLLVRGGAWVCGCVGAWVRQSE
jgi:hypothetical protein